MADSWADRPANLKFLIDSGLLFEINRTVLHLFGVALAVEKNPQTGELRIANDLKDCRKNPETLLYDDGTFQLGTDKLARFREESGDSLMEKRYKKLGWACQSHLRKQHR